MHRQRPGVARLGSGLLVLAAAAPLTAQEPARPPDYLVDAFVRLRACDPVDRPGAVESLVGGSVGLAEAARAARVALSARSPVRGWTEGRTPAGRPFQLYVPPELPADRPAPLVVFLHGGVTVPDYLPAAELSGMRGWWDKVAEREGFCVAMPAGRQDCAWWTDAGVAHVRETVREAKRLAPVADDRICLTGFSDGATGCWFFALAAPDPFAAIVPMNGSAEVASHGSGRQLYPENLPTTPLFVCHTRNDPLYPAAAQVPHWQAAWAVGASLTLHVAADGGHGADYFADVSPALMRFLRAARRDPCAGGIAWRCAEGALGRARWVSVLAVGPGTSDAPAAADLVVERAPDPLYDVLGVRVDAVPEGMPMPPGVAGPPPPAGTPMVRRLVPGGSAATMGMQPSDMIVEVDGRAVASLGELAAALTGRKPGAALKVGVRRFGVAEVKRLAGKVVRLNVAPPYLRTAPTARVAVRVDGTTIRIESRLVRKLRLDLAPGQFPPEETILVMVNGVERYRAIPPWTVRRLAERYAADADGAALVGAELLLDVP